MVCSLFALQIRFLRMIGLNSVVSDEMFVEFAQKIADGAKESAEVR